MIHLDLAAEILAIVAPAFIVALVGWGWARAGRPYEADFVTRLATNVATPCLVFSTLAGVEVEPEAFARMAGAAVLFHLLFALACAAYARAAGLDLRTWLTPLVFGNTGNLALPLAAFAFGPPGMAYAIVFFAVSCIFFFGVGVWWLSGEGSIAGLLRAPILWATALGFGSLMLDVDAPLFIGRAVGLLGQIAVPLMLMTLGVSLARLGGRGLGRAAVTSLARLAMGIAAGVAAGLAFGLGPVAMSVLVLQSAMPVAVFNYLFAARYDRSPTDVAGLILVSTVLSIATLPVVLAILLAFSRG